MDSLKVFKITDDRFSVDNIDQHDLIFELNLARFRFIIKNKASGIVIWLEDYYLGLETSLEDSIHIVSKIIKEHDFLQANFWNSIKVLTQNPFYYIISSDLYDDASVDKYFKILFPKLKFEAYKLEVKSIDKTEDIFISAFPKVIMEGFEAIYPNLEIDFKFSIFEVLNFFVKSTDLNSKNLILFDDVYANAFYIDKKSKNLVIEKSSLGSKHFIILLDQLIKKGRSSSVLFGEITTFSKPYKQLNSVTKATTIGKLPQNISLSQYFSEITEHRYLTLLTSY